LRQSVRDNVLSSSKQQVHSPIMTACLLDIDEISVSLYLHQEIKDMTHVLR